MTDDLGRITDDLRANPKDLLTIQALADWLEEQGAAPESVRALTVDGPTVLLFGWPMATGTPHMIEALREASNEICAFLTRATGHECLGVVLPAEITIRGIRGPVEPEG